MNDLQKFHEEMLKSGLIKKIKKPKRDRVLPLVEVSMILINSTELMASGDTFQMNWIDWHQIIYPPMGPHAVYKGSEKVSCRILRVFARSSREIRYVCVAIDDPRQTEFVLGQILELAYQVSVTHPTLKLSASVLVEAAAQAGVRSLSPEMPSLYTKEDAERVAIAAQDLPLTERNGYLVPSTNFQNLVEVKGKPISETIIEERSRD